MLIATFNVNSIKARGDIVADWLGEFNPDVVCFQELKCQTPDFPYERFQALGYQCEVIGQKAYNGVAIISKHPIELCHNALPNGEGKGIAGVDDEQARYLEVITGSVRIASIYLPNGNPVDTDKFPYKLNWMDRLVDHAKTLLAETKEPLVLAGDYNLCPQDDDCYDPVKLREDALLQPASRQRFNQLQHLGLYDAWRLRNPHLVSYSYWDYMQGRYQKDQGVRIDHFLLNSIALDHLMDTGIDNSPRAKEKPSDHTPVWIKLKIAP